MATPVTKTIKPTGGNYDSQNAAEAGEERNLVTADEICILECYAMEDTTRVSYSGWVSDATRYIKVYTPLTERHPGYWSTSAYRIKGHATWDAVITVTGTTYIRFEGIQIDNDGTMGTDDITGIEPMGAGEFRISIIYLIRPI